MFSEKGSVNSTSVTARKVAVRPRERAWIVWLALSSAALSKAMLTASVSVGDVLFGCAAAVCLLLRLKGQRLTHVPKWSIYVVLLIVWAAAGAFFARSYSFFAFSELEFWNSFAKLTFYGIGAVLLGSHFLNIGIDRISEVVLTFLTLNALIALYIYGAQLIEQVLGIRLPHEFFWFGQGGPMVVGHGISPMVVGSGIVLNKARGVFSEPANFGIFQVLGLAFIYLRASTPTTGSTWKHVIIFASLLLTFSLSAYGLLAVLLTVWAFKQKRVDQWKAMLKVMFGMVAIVVLAFSFAPVDLFNTIEDVIIRRFAGVAQLQDRTGVARVVASWDVAKTVIADSPVFGSGIGNLELAFLSSGEGYSSLVSQEVLTVTIRETAAAFNILFAVLGSLGVVGFFIFSLLLAHLAIGSPAAGIVFLVSTFATGVFLGPVFWVYYALLTTQTYG